MNKIKIIAEIGVNHNGNISIAKKLIDASKKAGADFVKFQIYNCDSHILKNSKLANYQKKNIKKNLSQYYMAKKYELGIREIELLNNYCKKKKINFLASIFDIKSLKIYLNLKKKYIKIPSGEITNYELLSEISNYNFIVFLSTGMSTIREIKNAVKILKSMKKIKEIYLMQCTSDYPCKDEDANLLVINKLKTIFKCKVGFSDHTIGADSASIAYTLGAEVFEKHITLNKKMIGPDHLASSEINEFNQYIQKINKTKILLGKNEKKPTKNELMTMKLVRKSIVAKRKIVKNEIFSKNNITVKRPGNGVSATLFLKLIGKKSKFKFIKDQKIKI